MKRRRFLMVVGSLASALVVADIANLPTRVVNFLRWGRRRHAQTHEIVTALETTFNYLNFETDSIEKFVHAYREQYSESVVLPIDDEIKRLLLLSTDFIQNRGDEGRVIKFVAFYSPYDTPCYNPYRWVNGEVT